MTQILNITRREIAGFFHSPIAYVVMAVFALLGAFLFFESFEPGRASSDVMRYSFLRVVQVCVFLVPALSMRLIAEEFRSGTIETLMTSPVSDLQAVTGKWLGALAFYAAMLAVPLIAIIGMVLIHSQPHPGYGQMLVGIAGLLMVGGMYLAVGLFASACTQNQIVAWIIAVLIIGLLTFLMDYVAQAGWASNALKDIADFVNVNQQAHEFAKGIASLAGAIYFVSVTCFFLFLAVKTLESRRWR